MRYQTYGVNAAGHCTHAGPNNVRRMDQRTAKRLQRDWVRWIKRQYRDGEHPVEFVDTTVALLAHPVGEPGLTERFEL